MRWVWRPSSLKAKSGLEWPLKRPDPSRGLTQDTTAPRVCVCVCVCLRVCLCATTTGTCWLGDEPRRNSIYFGKRATRQEVGKGFFRAGTQRKEARVIFCCVIGISEDVLNMALRFDFVRASFISLTVFI